MYYVHILSTTAITPGLVALAAEMNQDSSGSLVFTGIIDSNRPSESLACHRGAAQITGCPHVVRRQSCADPHDTESVVWLWFETYFLCQLGGERFRKRDHWTFTDRPTNNCRTYINISNYVSSWLFWQRKHQTCMGCTTWFTRIPHIKQRESESAFPALLEPYGKIAPVDQVGTVVHTSRSLVPLALLMAKDERPGGHGKMGPSWSVHQFCYWTKYYVDLRFLCSYTML